MTTSSQSSNPGRRVLGTVVSLNLSKHHCIMSIKEHGESRGNGLLDTTKLEGMLKGVSNLNAFIGISTKFIMNIIPLTAQRKREVDWSYGSWEIVWLRPHGRRQVASSLPSAFTAGGSYREPLPSMAYCQQILPSANIALSNPPPEQVAKVIHYFRKLQKIWCFFPIRELRNFLSNREHFPDAVDYFRTEQEVISFLLRYPQYFTIIDHTLTFPYRFPEDDFKKLLKQENLKSRSDERHTSPDYVLIESVDECKLHVDKLLQKVRSNAPFVLAVDCEGVRLGKEGPLTLLQLSTVEGEVFVFDILATPSKEDMFVNGGLRELLQNKQIVKVIHDSRGDQCALFFQFGVVLTNVFDTSVAYTTLWDQCNVFSGPFRPKLTKLQEIYGFNAKHKTVEFEKRVHEEKLFGQRPLTKDMIEYAVDDVRSLVPVIYEELNRLISPLWRPHFEDKVAKALEDSRIRDPNDDYEEGKE